MFDTHAHVHDAVFDTDRPAMLERARSAGVARILSVGCDLDDSRRAIAVAREHGLTASIGVHPHEAASAPDDLEAALDALAGPDRRLIAAVGETGLDYFYDHSPRQAQQEVFRKQIRYAQKLGLPLIFHQRDAFDDFVAIVREELPHRHPAVVHCFTGTPDQARRAIDEFGFFLGIGGVLTFKSAGALREAVRLTGPDHLVLETDAPYLAPVPLRGRRNEPAFVARTAEMLASVLELPFETVIERTSANARRLFGP